MSQIEPEHTIIKGSQFKKPVLGYSSQEKRGKFTPLKIEGVTFITRSFYPDLTYYPLIDSDESLRNIVSRGGTYAPLTESSVHKKLMEIAKSITTNYSGEPDMIAFSLTRCAASMIATQNKTRESAGQTIQDLFDAFNAAGLKPIIAWGSVKRPNSQKPVDIRAWLKVIIGGKTFIYDPYNFPPDLLPETSDQGFYLDPLTQAFVRQQDQYPNLFHPIVVEINKRT